MKGAEQGEEEVLLPTLSLYQDHKLKIYSMCFTKMFSDFILHGLSVFFSPEGVFAPAAFFTTKKRHHALLQTCSPAITWSDR
jgi:hypothetical protein